MSFLRRASTIEICPSEDASSRDHYRKERHLSFIHAREYLNSNQSVQVDCDTQCNVMLTDDANFSRYRTGGRVTYYGGFYEWFPAVIKPPHAGYWNITIDLGGAAANIRYSINVVG